MALSLPTPHALLLALDHSRTATGVAIGTPALGNARPLAVLREREEDARLAALQRLVAEWQPAALVVGLPLDREGGEQAQTRRVRRFAARIEAAFGLPVLLHDERYTTVVAEDALRSAGVGAAAAARVADAMAAREILQGYFDALLAASSHLPPESA